MVNVSEIAPDVYRISIFVPDFNLQFNHFLIKDDEPMLYHAGMKQMFPVLLEAVSKIISPSELMWIGFSHFEVDECGALNEWLQVAPNATAVCSEVGAIVNMGDFAIRPAHAMADNTVLNTGNIELLSGTVRRTIQCSTIPYSSPVPRMCPRLSDGP